MSLRMAEPPWGAARFAYGYLGTLLATAVAGLVSLIAYAIIGALPICSPETIGYCQPIRTALVGALVFFGCLFVVAHVIRLTWQWAAWFIAFTLVLFEIIVETDGVDLAWLSLLIPALAVVASFERPDRQISRKVRLARLIALAVIAIQFIIWVIVLLATPS